MSENSEEQQHIVKHYRHAQVLALTKDATPEEVAEYKKKKQRLFWRHFGEEGHVVFHNFILLLLALFWLLPIFWLLVSSFSSGNGLNKSTFFPAAWSVSHYVTLFTSPDSVCNFPVWFGNTLIVSIFTCLISTIFVLQVSFALSRMRFKGRKALMNISMILGLFPGLLSMICIYFIFKNVLNIDNYLIRLIIAYSASSGLGYLIAKGFFDTIPKDIDEAAKIDGATEFEIFTKITIPLSKPIIVYTVITSFMGPWVDFVFAKIILPSGDVSKYTVAIGLFNMLQKTLVTNYYTLFCCGCVIVSIPLSVLFLFTQKYYVAGVTGGAVKG